MLFRVKLWLYGFIFEIHRRFSFRAHCLAATTVAYRTVGAGEGFPAS